MKRILCIISSMNTGGAETFLMKMYRSFDRTKYQMDFCVVLKENYYESEIKSLGGKIYYIPLKSKHPIASFNAIKNIVRENNYKYVMRVNEHSLSTIDLLAAKCGGAKKLIMRSSNASSGSKISILLHNIFKFMPKVIPNVKFAPSTKSAEYTFGKRYVKKGKVCILKNGLYIEDFKFNEENRINLRRNLCIENSFVIGHIGRFSRQKNHNFLINVFNEVKKIKNNAVLVLIGSGSLEKEIKSKVLELGLDESVKFLGMRTDIVNLLSSMDVFLFPSFFEGMPNTVIEAQTSGLPCILSDTITKEAAVTKYVEFLSLNDSVKIWASKVLDFVDTYDEQRKLAAKEMRNNGYNIEDTVKLFIDTVFG